jgi:feruloyl esterase
LRRSLLWAATALSAMLVQVALAGSAADCARLATLKLPDTQLTAGVAEGPFDRSPWPAVPPPATPPAATPGAQLTPPPQPPMGDLPAFCRVRGMIKPAVRFEVWLPLKDWNGKFQGTGNGGYNGAIVYPTLAEGLRRGYATANTDMGHLGTSPDPGSWALHHPELVIDQGYRAQHETAVKAKAIVQAFYGKPPGRSYFVGCSSGGWQALTEAHRYPHDYDGLIAGAPASEVVHLHAAQIWGFLAATQLSAAKLRLVADAALAKCDARDGVKDGLISNPLGCDFQPAELACKQDQATEGCLTPAEVTAMQKLYSGAHYASGAQVYPGWPRGGEQALVQAASPAVPALTASTYRDMVFEDPQWDYHTINFDRDVKAADEKVGAVMNDGSTDLAELRRAGGKLILWHGWADPLISSLHTIEYYRKLAQHFSPGADEATAVSKLSDFARLFLAPGVYHCGNGPGPSSFDSVGALEQWVEHGVAPDSLLASHVNAGKTDRTRPLCPYPKQAVYDGKGNSDDAASFRCQ